MSQSKKFPVRDFYYLGDAQIDKEGRIFMGGKQGDLLVRTTRSEQEVEDSLNSPNELLRVTAIEQRARSPYGRSSKARGEMLVAAFERALGEAKSEGILWTPVMDIIAAINENMIYGKSVVVVLDALIEEQLGAIREEAKNYSLDELIGALKSFDYSHISALPWSSGDIKFSKVKEFLKENGVEISAVAQGLAANKDVSNAVLGEFVVGIYSQGKGRLTTFPLNDRVYAIVAQAVSDRGGLNPKLLARCDMGGHGRRAELAKMAVAHPDTDVDTLETIATDGTAGPYIAAEALSHPKAAAKAIEWIKNINNNSIVDLWERLAENLETKEEWIRAIADLWTPNTGGVRLAALLISHPNVTNAQVLKIGQVAEEYQAWSHKDKAPIRAALANREIVRQNKELWKVLETSQSQEVLVGMVEGARDNKELERAVKRLRKSSVQQLLETLNKMQIKPQVVLPQKLLAPILATGSQKEREGAIKALGRWGQEQAKRSN